MPVNAQRYPHSFSPSYASAQTLLIEQINSIPLPANDQELQQQLTSGQLPINVSFASNVPTELRTRVNEAVRWLSSAVRRDDPIDVNIQVISELARAHYISQTRSIVLSPTTTIRTIVHELAHALELQLNLDREAIKLLIYRSQGIFPTALTDLSGANYEEDEFAVADSWFHPYVGKSYRAANGDFAATEIISMGIEALYADGISFINRDPIHARFILGILKGSIR